LLLTLFEITQFRYIGDRLLNLLDSNIVYTVTLPSRAGYDMEATAITVTAAISVIGDFDGVCECMCVLFVCCFAE